ncbi:MAG: metallophosphoesterase family protein [Oscillospiraceae bacterium]|nr:metallophosphoesterase family protein [Oscillospiraceae bacterium]
MKLGIITDIHNNLPALKTVLNRLRQLDCEWILCCGDIIGIGPQPEQTVQTLLQLPNLIAVRGNHERYLLEGLPDTFPNAEQMDEAEAAHHRWEHSLLSPESRDFLRQLPYRRDLELAGYRISLLHYGMDRDARFLNIGRNPSAEDYQRLFSNVDSDLIFFGHQHTRSIHRADKYYVNVGSLGCPGREKHIARAGVVSLRPGRVEITSLDLEYDAGAVVREIDRLHYPAAEEIKHIFYRV